MTPNSTGGPATRQILDQAASVGMIGRMIRRLIFRAMRASMQELVTSALQEVTVQLQEMKEQIWDMAG